jgi:hypothetical protein
METAASAWKVSPNRKSAKLSPLRPVTARLRVALLVKVNWPRANWLPTWS